MIDITTLLGQYAFPVVACIAMGWYIKDQTKTNQEHVEKISDQHAEEMKEITSALNNNTLALQKLVDFFKKGDNEDGNE